ncbi:MAG: ABC transporter permease [Chloroflexi bacterium]|nr:ABC transporter permease [Chloroflexota bacterium]MCH8114754.1 ABC transporter permease [Chloroflexota bacterium]MCI0774143.1 ABC transporter permease [Chloroflexota bacterium]MCI0804368.1 ABC transporter permease [Chloroflexota bacterium]MCI0807559.1 ABC transporter permease [Chloroflexota bacterium]
MRFITVIAVKEIRTYFGSPMAYVVSAAFLAITGFFFVASVSDAFAEASIRGYLAGAVFFMIFMSPALTMRLIAEEQKLGTLELLLTSPIREFEIVIGKFIAAFVMMAIMTGLSLYFVVVLFIYGDPDIGPLLSGFLGLGLYAAATLAVGLFASALSSNQIVGLIVGSGILTALTIIDFVSERLTGLASQVLDGFQLGASFSVFDLDSFGVAQGGHFADFAKGIISVSDIAYYISLTAVFLLLTVLVLEARRWR